MHPALVAIVLGVFAGVFAGILGYLGFLLFSE